jgi:hypothetical protein
METRMKQLINLQETDNRNSNIDLEVEDDSERSNSIIILM